MVSARKLEETATLLKELNPHAVFVTTPTDRLDTLTLKNAIEGAENGLESLIEEIKKAVSAGKCEHEHHHDENCTCGCQDHVHEHSHEHHHEHDESSACGCHNHEHEHENEHSHEHYHEHDENCACGCHDHDHAHHGAHGHAAAEVFTSFGRETVRKFTSKGLEKILESLYDSATYGDVLRAKGIVEGEDGVWFYFDYVPGESDIRRGMPGVTGKYCVIGANLAEEKIEELFRTAGAI